MKFLKNLTAHTCEETAVSKHPFEAENSTISASVCWPLETGQGCQKQTHCYKSKITAAHTCRGGEVGLKHYNNKTPIQSFL